MNYLHRGLEESILATVPHFGALLLTGPRQAGKSTLLRQIAKDLWGDQWHAFSFDTPSDIAQLTQDPELFFMNHPGPLLLDEVQNVPSIFPWLKKFVDQSSGQLKFLMTGSQQFPLMRGVAESMAGRIFVCDLYPFSQRELNQKSSSELANALSNPKLIVERLGLHIPCSDSQIIPAMFRGGYPAQAIQNIGGAWFNSYRATYIQRDIRLLGRIENLGAFDKFLVLCAGLSGTLPNKTNLADHLQVDSKTVDHWLTLLQSSYQIQLIPAWTENTVKRVVKRPKLIFTDSGLALHLQAIRDSQALLNAPHFGNMFESWVIMEILKSLHSTSIEFGAYYSRTSNGVECDLVIQSNGQLIPFEIKHTSKPNSSDCKGLLSFCREHRNAPLGVVISLNPRVEWIAPNIINCPVGFFF